MRNAIHAFEQRGEAGLKQASSRPKTVQAQFDQAKCEALRALLHQSPRTFGKATSCWMLELAAEVCFEQGLTAIQVCIETIRLALKRLGVAELLPSLDMVALDARGIQLVKVIRHEMVHRHYDRSFPNPFSVVLIPTSHRHGAIEDVYYKRGFSM